MCHVGICWQIYKQPTQSKRCGRRKAHMNPLNERPIMINKTLRPFLLVALLTISTHPYAQESIPAATQNPNATFRLFNTQNIYTLLKLDTRDGRIWQLQWGALGNRFSVPLNPTPVVTTGQAGRFTLYPTKNIYTFVLLDQETGNTWHVQWGNSADRFTLPINDINQ